MFDLFVISTFFAMVLAPCVVALRAALQTDLVPATASIFGKQTR